MSASPTSTSARAMQMPRFPKAVPVQATGAVPADTDPIPHNPNSQRSPRDSTGARSPLPSSQLVRIPSSTSPKKPGLAQAQEETDEEAEA